MIRWSLSLFYVCAIVFLVLLFAGCGALPTVTTLDLGADLADKALNDKPAPLSLELDRDFSDGQRAAAQDAVDQWCDAVDWCPTIGLGGKHKVILLGHEAFVVKDKDVGAFAQNNHDGNIYIDRDAPEFTDESWAWTMFAHEFYHYGLRAHRGPEGSLPSATPLQVFELDQHAIDAWCGEQGC